MDSRRDASQVQMAKARVAVPRAHSSHAMDVRSRELVAVHRGPFHNYGCSRCGWEFLDSANPPTDASLLAIIHFYEAEREKEFAAHRCDQYPATPRLAKHN
jgi:hypothetical protein